MFPSPFIFPDRARHSSISCPSTPRALAVRAHRFRGAQQLPAIGAGAHLVEGAVEVADLAVGGKDYVVEEVGDAALYLPSQSACQSASGKEKWEDRKLGNIAMYWWDAKASGETSLPFPGSPALLIDAYVHVLS